MRKSSPNVEVLAVDDEALRRAQHVWSSGDYEPTARQLLPASVQLVNAMGIGPSDHALDIGTGTGNCAIAMAQRGANVTAVDLSEAMLHRARRRIKESSLSIELHEAEAGALPSGDRTFTAVASVFGLIFAPDHDAAAAEAVRVTAHGGRIGFTAWAADGFMPRLFEAADRHLPPDPSDGPTMFDWGDQAYARARFQPHGAMLTAYRREVTFRYPDWDAWENETLAHGLFQATREMLTPDDFTAMVEDVRELVARENRSTDGRIAYRAEYLEFHVSVF